MNGQAALSTIFLIGGVIVLFGVSLAVIAISFANSAIGFQASNRALAAASGGVRDAELQLLRNKDFSDPTTGYCVPASNIPCPDGYALVKVAQNSPASGQVAVTAESTVNRRRRKVQAIYSLSASSTQLSILSYRTLNQ